MSDDSSGILILVGLALVAWLGYQGWPVTGWLLAVGAAYWALSLLKKHGAVAGLGRDRFPMLQAIISGLATTCGWFAVGVGCVWTVQLLSKLISRFVEESTVRAAENALGRAKFVLDSIFAPKYLVAMLVLLVVMTAVAPEAQLASRFGRLRKYVSRTGGFLAGITSFTFFTSTCIGAYESAWVAKRRTEVKEHISHVERLASAIDTMNGLAWELRRLPPPVAQEVQEFLVHAEARPNRDMLLAWRANAIAESAARDSEQAYRKASSDTLPQFALDDLVSRTHAAMQRLHRWTHNDESASPTIQQVLDVSAAHERMELRFKESETILAETLKLVLGAAIPADTDGVVKLFAKTLTGAVASHTAKQAIDEPTKSLSRAALLLSLTSPAPYLAREDEVDSKPVIRWSLDLPAKPSRDDIAFAEERIEEEAFAKRYDEGYRPQEPAFRAAMSGVALEENGRRYESKSVEPASRSGAAAPDAPVPHPAAPHEGSYGAPHHYTRRIVIRR